MGKIHYLRSLQVLKLGFAVLKLFEFIPWTNTQNYILNDIIIPTITKNIFSQSNAICGVFCVYE